MQDAWNKDAHSAIHDRWQSQLRAHMPLGVPVSAHDPTWPETFTSQMTEFQDRDIDEVRQCLFCRYYCALEGPLGMDWGACLKAGGQYDRQVVFEHWTCRDFENAPDSQDPHPEWYQLMADSHAHLAQIQADEGTAS